MKKALDSSPSVEMRRRIEPILERAITGTLSADQLRGGAMEALEKAGTPEARQLLQALAQGAPGRDDAAGTAVLDHLSNARLVPC